MPVVASASPVGRSGENWRVSSSTAGVIISGFIGGMSAGVSVRVGSFVGEVIISEVVVEVSLGVVGVGNCSDSENV